MLDSKQAELAYIYQIGPKVLSSKRPVAIKEESKSSKKESLASQKRAKPSRSVEKLIPAKAPSTQLASYATSDKRSLPRNGTVASYSERYPKWVTRGTTNVVKIKPNPTQTK